jgi:hypothetical protein
VKYQLATEHWILTDSINTSQKAFDSLIEVSVTVKLDAGMLEIFNRAQARGKLGFMVLADEEKVSDS